MEERYVPPFTITPEIIHLVAEVSEQVGSITAWDNMNANPQLRRDQRIRTIHASLAIENNSLSLEQVTAIISGKRILGLPGEIQEVKNAYEAYEHLLSFNPYNAADMLNAHRILMADLMIEPGMFRRDSVGVFAEGKLIHMAPPAEFVGQQIDQLLAWTKDDPTHPLIKSCVFHYEFEYIHPFSDGYGRVGRLWQTLLLSQWKPLFAWLPVESLIRERQEDYYAVLRKADSAANSTVVIAFLLTAIRDALSDIVTENSQNTQISTPVRRLLNGLGNDTLSCKELMARIGLKSRSTFRKNYLEPALDQKLIEMTVPGKPNSRNQKYRKSSG